MVPAWSLGSDVNQNQGYIPCFEAFWQGRAERKSSVPAALLACNSRAVTIFAVVQARKIDLPNTGAR